MNIFVKKYRLNYFLVQKSVFLQHQKTFTVFMIHIFYLDRSPYEVMLKIWIFFYQIVYFLINL